MRISLEWLQNLIDIDILGLSPEDLAHSLTMLGLAVELIERKGEDVSFEIDVTTNRPDCLNHLGVARELSAQFRLKLRYPDFASPPVAAERQSDFPMSIEIHDPELCPRYAGRVLTDVRIAESPNWLKKRLEAIGQRPINNVVDITNYVLFEVGHPLHAFDYERLRGGKIVVRRARPAETIRTLDGMERTPDDAMLMICDAAVPVAVAGVMGGEGSEVTDTTTTLLLESAFFEPSSVRRTSKKLGLSTQASYRFERGADPLIPVRALNLACRLITEICGGVCVSPVIDVNPIEFEHRTLTLRRKRVGQVLGVDLDLGTAAGILESLEFNSKAEGHESLVVRVPSFRPDVELEDDLVEEVARHFGYDRIPSHFPRPSRAGGGLATDLHDQILMEGLTGFGFYQAINYVFSSPEREAACLGESRNMVAIANPLNELDTHLRTSLLPGMLEAVRRNLNFGQRDIRLFEFGKSYHPGSEASGPAVIERSWIALVGTGDFYSPYWRQEEERFGFRHMKGILERLAGRLGFDAEFRPVDWIAYLHPGVSAEILGRERELGMIGEVHPRLREEYKFPERVYYAELDLDRIYSFAQGDKRFSSPGRFPAVERDLSFILDKSVTFNKIEGAIQALGIPELDRFRLIDLYHGPSLPQDRLSLTVRLTFEAPDRTLTQSEVAEYCDSVLRLLKDRFGVKQR